MREVFYQQMKNYTEEWKKQVDKVLLTSRLEVKLLREKVSTEILNRVKLLHEVQDVSIDTNVSVDLLLY